MSESVRSWCRRTMKLVNKIGYIAKKIDEYDTDFYEMRDAHLDNESYVERIDKCYDEFQKALRQLQPQAGGHRRCNRKTRRSKK
jgi:hypothetical protein